MSAVGSTQEEWKKSETEVFWGEIAPCNHLLQIYENDEVILDSLEGFVSSGLRNDESVVIIASEEHTKALNRRLILHGFDLEQLKKQHHFTALDADKTLEKFMINGWPDDDLFLKTVTEVISTARGAQGRKVRAYGEMVAILWANGNNGATVHLEHLWNKFCESEVFCLFCAYPKSGFTQDVSSSLEHICAAHTKLLDGRKCSTTEVFYRSS